MGYDKGFDFVWDGTSDLSELWETFLSKVKERYNLDPNVIFYDSPGDEVGTAILFKVGEYPRIPFYYQYFKRFSSKVSGGCRDAEEYISDVSQIATKIFNGIIQCWHEDDFPNSPAYSWDEVYHTTDEYKIFLQGHSTKSANK